MRCALDSGSSDPGSRPGRGHCVRFLGKSLYSRGASLSLPEEYRKSSIKPPPSLISPPFQRRKVNKPLLPPPRILYPSQKGTGNDKRGLISYGLFRLEVHIVFGLPQHDLQLHMLKFLNFALYFSVENFHHCLIVIKSSIPPGNHKPVLEKPCSYR